MKSLDAVVEYLRSLLVVVGTVILVVTLSSCSTESLAPPAVASPTRLPAVASPTRLPTVASPTRLIVATEAATSTDSALAIARLYDATKLESVRARYERTTNRILDEIVWPVLLSGEKDRLGGRPTMRFPLWAEGIARQHPLAFYNPADTDDIVFPIYSLKFLEDLCTAYAWLQINGYSLETISEYTAILKYGEAPSGGFPSPLEALGIPADALDNSEVDELALGHFVTARLFIMLHEAGHILYGHQARTAADSLRNEQEADSFAIKVMRRTPLPPLGILVYFIADAHWTSFPANEHNTHPLSGQRIRALAGAVDDPLLAFRLNELGKLVDDPDVRAGFVATGKAGNIGALRPRRSGELPSLSPGPVQQGCGAPFDGAYRGQIVQFPEPESFMVEMHLVRRGNNVTGQYSFGLGIGTIAGNIVNDQLYFDWTWLGNYGKGVFTSSDDRGFQGSWGYRENQSNAGTWSGQCSESAR